MNLTKTKQLKEKFRKREKIFGAWTSLGHPQITEMFANSDVDFIGIDIEHSTISLEQSQRIIAASQAGGTTCLPRIASHSMESIKRLLDSGADGIIAPMVSTAEEAQNIIGWSKYPPMGSRSFGIARGQNYGFQFPEYTKSWNTSGSVIVQIESILGVQNIESILKLDHIDGVMIGPYDLSGTLGIPGELEHPKVLEACKKVTEACKKFGKACGTQVVEPDQSNVDAKFNDGYTFVVLSSDIFLMWKWAESMKGLIHRYR